MDDLKYMYSTNEENYSGSLLKRDECILEAIADNRFELDETFFISKMRPLTSKEISDLDRIDIENIIERKNEDMYENDWAWYEDSILTPSKDELEILSKKLNSVWIEWVKTLKLPTISVAVEAEEITVTKELIDQG